MVVTDERSEGGCVVSEGLGGLLVGVGGAVDCEEEVEVGNDDDGDTWSPATLEIVKLLEYSLVLSGSHDAEIYVW